ncbi:hypothetical protein MTP99_009391 [Tenebrio molitor]|nr:hypothetical protein MTP99_009391 [Tenebrio molitor]
MPKKSEVWKYFDQQQDGKATCKLCHKRLKTSGNTSNLLGHITRVHKLNKVTEKDTQSETSESETMSTSASAKNTIVNLNSLL